MRKYLIDLTSHTIGNNGYDHLPPMDDAALLKHITLDLEAGAVHKMTPAKLGEILCAFETGDIPSQHPGKEVRFTGDCEMMLRELVSLCLAYVIRARLVNPEEDPRFPAYKRKLKR